MGKTVFSDTPPLGTVVRADFLNALQSHRHSGQDADGSAPLDYAVTTGSGNAYVLTLSPVLAAHIPGMPIRFMANHANTGAATIAVNGLTAVPFKKNFNQALIANDIKAGQILTMYFDGTNYQLPEVSSIGLGTANFKLFMAASGLAPEWAAGIKIVPFTRAWNAASGNVAYTGAGFKPSAMIALYSVYDGTYNHLGIGFSDFAQSYSTKISDIAATGAGGNAYFINMLGHLQTAGQYAIPVSADADGVTLAWTLVGSPAAVTINGSILMLR